MEECVESLRIFPIDINVMRTAKPQLNDLRRETRKAETIAKELALRWRGQFRRGVVTEIPLYLLYLDNLESTVGRLELNEFIVMG